MNERIKYLTFKGFVTLEEAKAEGSYRKIYYDGNIKRRLEAYDKYGLSWINHYLRPEENEQLLVEELLKEAKEVAMIVSMSIESYYIERVRVYREDGLYNESEQMLTQDFTMLYSDPTMLVKVGKNRRGNVVQLKKYKRFIYWGNHISYDYFFGYNSDESFGWCGLTISGGLAKDSRESFSSFSEIHFPKEEEMPIKKEYFATGHIDPTGFEIERTHKS